MSEDSCRELLYGENNCSMKDRFKLKIIIVRKMDKVSSTHLIYGADYFGMKINVQE